VHAVTKPVQCSYTKSIDSGPFVAMSATRPAVVSSSVANATVRFETNAATDSGTDHSACSSSGIRRA
jgi:hypothetical protein